MKILESVPERKRHWYELFARSANTPYRDILVTAERVADYLEEQLETDDAALEHYNNAFEIVEKRQGTTLSMGQVGECLVILSNFWTHGDALLDKISFIERKIVIENVTFRLKTMAEDAQKEATP